MARMLWQVKWRSVLRILPKESPSRQTCPRLTVTVTNTYWCLRLSEISKHCAVSPEGRKLPENAVTKPRVSARERDPILRVTRTIADLDGAANVEAKYLSESIQCRALDPSSWSHMLLLFWGLRIRRRVA